MTIQFTTSVVLDFKRYNAGDTATIADDTAWAYIRTGEAHPVGLPSDDLADEE